MTRPLIVEGLITLYQLDTARLGGPVHYFGSAEDISSQIIWGGNEYIGLPMEATGFEMTSKGALPQPSITIANLYGAGNTLLDTYNGLIGAEVTRILTLRRFLDDGATPDPNAFITRDKFVVSQKTSHNAVAIVFKLASRMDHEGTQLPRRLLMRDLCTHTYRIWVVETQSFDYSHASCPYTGPNNFDTNDGGTTHDRDQCSRTINGCGARFAPGVLPGRFFPGVGKVR